MRRQNEGSFGCEAVARALGQPNVPECAVGFHNFLSLCSKNSFIILSLSFFFGLLVTAGNMANGGLRASFLFCNYKLLCGEDGFQCYSHSHWLYCLLWCVFLYSNQNFFFNFSFFFNIKIILQSKPKLSSGPKIRS